MTGVRACTCTPDCRIAPCIAAGHVGQPGISGEWYETAGGQITGVLGEHGRCLDCGLDVVLPPPAGVKMSLYQRGMGRAPLMVAHLAACPARVTPEVRRAAEQMAGGPKLQPWQSSLPPLHSPSEVFPGLGHHRAID